MIFSRGEVIMSTNIVRLHRVLRASPERIYRAFLDPDAKAKWLPPNGFTGKVHHIDAKVGGTYKMSFTNFTTGKSHSFGGTYVELVPHELIRYTDKFDNPNLPGAMQDTSNGGGSFMWQPPQTPCCTPTTTFSPLCFTNRSYLPRAPLSTANARSSRLASSSASSCFKFASRAPSCAICSSTSFFAS